MESEEAEALAVGGPHPHPGEPEEGCEEVGAVELGEGDDAWVG